MGIEEEGWNLNQSKCTYSREYGLGRLKNSEIVNTARNNWAWYFEVIAHIFIFKLDYSDRYGKIILPGYFSKFLLKLIRENSNKILGVGLFFLSHLFVFVFWTTEEGTVFIKRSVGIRKLAILASILPTNSN